MSGAGCHSFDSAGLEVLRHKPRLEAVTLELGGLKSKPAVRQPWVYGLDQPTKPGQGPGRERSASIRRRHGSQSNQLSNASRRCAGFAGNFIREFCDKPKLRRE